MLLFPFFIFFFLELYLALREKHKAKATYWEEDKNSSKIYKKNSLS